VGLEGEGRPAQTSYFHTETVTSLSQTGHRGNGSFPQNANPMGGTRIAPRAWTLFPGVDPLRRSLTLTVLALALASFPIRTSLHSQSSTRFYRVDDIGTLGVNEVRGLAINDNGDVTGNARLPSGEEHAFRYTDARGMEDLGGAALGPFSQAFGINSAGDIVGVFLDANFNTHGFLAPAGSTMQDLFTEDRWITMVTSITDDGRLAGGLLTPSGDVHPFRTLLSGEIHDLGSPGFKGMAWRMNAAGQVTGHEAPTTYPASGRSTAFRYSDSAGKVDLGTLGGPISFGLAINAGNVIVGCADLSDVEGRAFRAREGGPMENLGTLGGEWSCAEGINDNGEIVGWSDLANRQAHAFVYTDSEGMIDLHTVIPPNLDLRLMAARAINNRGQIVVESNTLAGLRTYRLTPVERVDQVPPVIQSTSVTPVVIWPPDGRMVPATVSVVVTDNLDPSPGCRITSVGAYESGSLVPDSQSDAVITGDLTLSLRARRSGSDTRHYDGVLSCVDASGNVASTTVRVTVPHDSSSGME